MHMVPHLGESYLGIGNAAHKVIEQWSSQITFLCSFLLHAQTL